MLRLISRFRHESPDQSSSLSSSALRVLRNSVEQAPKSAPPKLFVVQPRLRPQARLTSNLNEALNLAKSLQMGTLRPWKQVLDRSALVLPSSYSESMSRLRRNASYFQLNYALSILIVLFCSLVFHPLSIIVFLLLFTLWLSLLFLYQAPLVVFGRPLSDGAVMALLGVLTVLSLVWTGLGSLVFGALLVGVGLVGVHAVLRGADDLFLDEDQV